MFSMKTVLLLALFLYAAAAAPAEDKPEAPEAVVDPQEEQMAAVPGQEEEEEASEARYRACPAYWQQLGPRCFRFVGSTMSWYNAKKYCNRIGGNLATVNNPRVDSFLEQMTWSAGERDVWLGGSYQQGKWVWTDRTGFHYTNWYSQLNPSRNPCLYLSTNNGWGNKNCYNHHCFICSRNA